MRVLRGILSVPTLLMLGALPIGGQQSRSALIDEAFATFTPDEAVGLLAGAADPNLEAPDSVWVLSVHYLADFLLIDLDRAAEAELWLTWIDRHREGREIDLDVLRPAASEMANAVRESVASSRGPDDARVTTRWTWPSEYDPGVPGRIRVGSAPPDASVTVAVVGRGEALPVDGSLAPGSYELEIRADGYEPVRVTREVLPGVTTTLDLGEVLPVLPEATRTSAAERLVSVSWSEEGQRVCANGLLDRNAVFTVLSADVATRPLIVTTRDGTFDDLHVARRSESTGVSVVMLDPTLSAPAPSTVGVAAGQWGWALYRPGCDADVSEARVRIAGVPSPVAVSIEGTLPSTARGAPLVDRSGAVFGLVTGVSSILSVSRAQEMLEEAIVALRDPPGDPGAEGGGGGGGRTWAYIGGAGAAGVLAAVLLSGGDETDTGTIIIDIPGGTP